ncbi:MAG: aminotransferase class V-fold PLP-dependent enzyme [Pyrinomonadaceae bacterium]|nr:aminotransferase class V-fold PLP-dependent enzyme [Phycisphaerales bacterium]
MTPDEFRVHGHAMIDWIAGYWERLGKGGDGEPEFPVLSQVRPGEIAAGLPLEAPEEPEAWAKIVGDVDALIMPGITHWQSPSFFAYFPANGSGPALLGDLLSGGLGVNGMLWATSPAATELETRVLDWMAALIGLPAGFHSTSRGGGGVIQGTASESTLIAMLAARERARRLEGRVGAQPGPASDESGGAARPVQVSNQNVEDRFVVYTSTQAHSSIIKGAMVAGIAIGPNDRRRVRLIQTDERLAMDPRLLEEAMETDRAAGLIPGYVCATVGTTSSGAIDPVKVIGAICKRHGAWLHVDAAYAGAACVCPEHRWMLDGIELADSMCFNPHKWLLTNFDCDLFWTQDKASVTGALSITPEYLRNAASEAGAVIDYRDWQIPLGRRFRALKLWFVIRHYGASGLRAFVSEHIRLAELFEQKIRDDERFEISAPRSLSLVCFRLKGDGEHGDQKNNALLAAINASGRAYLTHTVLLGADGHGRVVLRLAIGATMTQERHVEAVWELIQACAEVI